MTAAMTADTLQASGKIMRTVCPYGLFDSDLTYQARRSRSPLRLRSLSVQGPGDSSKIVPQGDIS